MSVPNYKKFNVVSARSELAQTYVTTDDHAWIKQQASANKVKMTAVVSSLVDHAQTSEEAFKHLIHLLKQQNEVLKHGGILHESVVADIEETLEKYEV